MQAITPKSSGFTRNLRSDRRFLQGSLSTADPFHRGPNDPQVDAMAFQHATGWTTVKQLACVLSMQLPPQKTKTEASLSQQPQPTSSFRQDQAMTLKALVIDKQSESEVTSAIQTLTEDQLPKGNVTVAINYTTIKYTNINYKDGLCITSGSGLVRNDPLVPGIDFSGPVERSQDDRDQPGDQVVLTGWKVGESH